MPRSKVLRGPTPTKGRLWLLADAEVAKLSLDVLSTSDAGSSLMVLTTYGRIALRTTSLFHGSATLTY